jgi:hypothetical protein
MLKYLRIAVTALNLTACVLLVALWARSYSWFDMPQGRIGDRNLFIQSVQGELRFSAISDPRQFGWDLTSDWVGPDQFGLSTTIAGDPIIRIPRLFSLSWNSIAISIWVPHWLPVLLFAAMAALTWINHVRRFSLRTLLIVTTLVAVGLGTVIYLSG